LTLLGILVYLLIKHSLQVTQVESVWQLRQLYAISSEVKIDPHTLFRLVRDNFASISEGAIFLSFPVEKAVIKVLQNVVIANSGGIWSNKRLEWRKKRKKLCKSSILAEFVGNFFCWEVFGWRSRNRVLLLLSATSFFGFAAAFLPLNATISSMEALSLSFLLSIGATDFPLWHTNFSSYNVTSGQPSRDICSFCKQ
jgi:hypothetical protein